MAKIASMSLKLLRGSMMFDSLTIARQLTLLIAALTGFANAITGGSGWGGWE